MKRIIKTEKVLIHNENMDLVEIKTRVKMFGKEILTYKENTSNNQLKTA